MNALCDSQLAHGCRGVYGSFPSDFTSASPTLKAIQLQSNAITGPTPDFSFLTNLATLDLHYNQVLEQNHIGTKSKYE